jgi:hypothetical protein
MVYKSGRLHAPVRKYSMSKLANNREILYFKTAVLAEPNDHNSGRLGTARILVAFFSQYNCFWTMAF